ncbi:MAG: IS3 family transposase [Thermoanaerobacter sp.]|nr:IS3 family transposase [Thermoanaerobacter sp.]
MTIGGQFYFTIYTFRTRRTQEDSKPQEGDACTKELKRSGRPRSTYSLTRGGRKVSDEEIKEYLTELVCGEGFPYGYRKLTICLWEDYGLIINHKKVYRLCKELDILLPQRKVKREKPRVLAKREEVTGLNQLWEMDVKYGYIPGTDQFFFQLSLLDVFDRMVIDYHLGLSCTAIDASRVLENGLRKRGLYKGAKMPKLRTEPDGRSTPRGRTTPPGGSACVFRWGQTSNRFLPGIVPWIERGSTARTIKYGRQCSYGIIEAQRENEPPV